MKFLAKKLKQIKVILKHYNQIADINLNKGELIIYLNHFDVFNFIASQKVPVRVKIKQTETKDEKQESFYLA